MQSYGLPYESASLRVTLICFRVTKMKVCLHIL